MTDCDLWEGYLAGSILLATSSNSDSRRCRINKMPALSALLLRRASDALNHLESALSHTSRGVVVEASRLAKRVDVPFNQSSPAGLIEANTRDPYNRSGKYALGWVYFSIILLVCTAIVRYYHLWTDIIRAALFQEEVSKSSKTSSPDTDYELSDLYTDKSTAKFFPRTGALPAAPEAKDQSSVSSVGWINNAIALLRSVFYRPLPVIQLKKGWRPLVFPSLGVIFVVFSATAFSLLYCFIPQPLYWRSIEFGAPPVTVRSGMMAVAMMPWIIALSMKANIVSLLTGIGHERLNVLHRWGGYLCLLLSLIHTIPFYTIPSSDARGLEIYKSYFSITGFYVFGTG